MSTATASMSFSEFVDVILLRLYELERKDPSAAGAYFSLNDIAANLRDAVPPAWIRDAGKVLEARQLAHCAFLVGGAVRARLSGEGRLFVEEARGRIPELRQRERAGALYLHVSGTNNQVIVGDAQTNVSQTMTIEKEREPAFTLIREIRAALQKDPSLEPRERADLVTDLEQVDTQLKKREPNRPALAALLEPLSQVQSIAIQVLELMNLLNP